MYNKQQTTMYAMLLIKQLSDMDYQAEEMT